MGDFFGGQNNAPPDTELRRMTGPWQPVQEPLRDFLGQLQSYYTNPRNMPEFGPGVVQPFNPFQLAGLQGGLEYAEGGMPGYQAGIGDFSSYATGGRRAPGMNLYENLMGGAYRNPAMGGFRDIAGQARAGEAGGAGIDTLRRFASGEMLGANPYRDELLDIGTQGIRRGFMESVNPTIEGIVGRSGAGGGGSMEALMRGQAYNELSQNLGDFSNQFLGNVYESDVGRQLAAAGQLPGAEATRIGTALAGQGAYANQYQQDLANRLAGAQGAGNVYQQNYANQLGALNAMPGMFAGGLAPFQAMQGMGGILQTQAEREAQEAQQQFRWNPEQEFMNQYMQSLLSVGAAGNPGALQGFYGRPDDPSFGQQLLGALSGAGAAAAGGYAQSDRRLKDILRRIGQTAEGVPLYLFVYKTGAGPVGPQIGVIAQELQKTQPDAVSVGPAGYLQVDYSKVK